MRMRARRARGAARDARHVGARVGDTGDMRMLVGLVMVLALAGCTSKKKAPPPAAVEGSGSTAPVLQPVENKLDNAMDQNEKRAQPEPD